jgi:hypothetical protein
MDRELVKQLRADAKQLAPELGQATARYAPYKGTPGVAFGGPRAVTSSGVPGKVLARALEYGSDGRRWRDYVETRNGRAVPVLRRTTRQFVPDASGLGGRWITPAAESVGPDVLAEWIETVESLSVSALNGGR